MSVFMMMPHEVGRYIAQQMQAKRLSFNFSQKTLSERSGVSLSVIKKFERTGKISLESFLKLALVLDFLKKLKELFDEPAPETFKSLDDLLKDNTRKRGRE